jgi:predicted dehydrogenase
MSPAKAAVRFAVIGAGRVFEVYQRAIRQLPGAELVAIVDPRFEGQLFGDVPTFTSLEDCLHSSEFDAAIVLSPTDYHVDHAQRLIEAGRPVLVEKPVSLDVDRIELLRKTAAERGVIVWPSQTNVYDPDLQLLKRSLDEGELGDVGYSCLSYWKEHTEEMSRSYPEILAQHAIHLIYSSIFLNGRAERVSCHFSQFRYRDPDHFDQASVTLLYPNRSMLVLCVSIAVGGGPGPGHTRFEVIGTKGSFCRDWRASYVELPTTGRVPIAYVETFVQLLSHFSDAVTGAAGTEPLSSLADSSSAECIRQACLKSASTGSVVTVDYR